MIIQNLIYKFKKKSLKLLKKNSELSLIYQFKTEIESYEIEKNIKKNSPFLKSLESKNINSYIKTKVLSKLINLNFNKFILISYFFYSGNKIVAPLPKILIKKLHNKIGKTNQRLSSFFFVLIMIKEYLLSIHKLIRINLFFAKKTLLIDNRSKIIFLSSIGSGNFNNNSLNIFKWFQDNILSKDQFVTIVHSNKNFKNHIKTNNIEILYSEFPFINSIKIKSLLLLNYVILKKFLYSLTFIFNLKNNWFNILILKEIFETECFKFCDLKPTEFYFNNSDYLNRPLWSYLDKNIINKTYFYFYSLNYRNLHPKSFYFPRGYYSMYWPNYLLWSNNHLKELKEKNVTINNYKIINDSISFSDNNTFFKKNEKKTISLFNIQPLKGSHLINYSLDYDDYYYNNNVSINFYKILLNIISNYNIRCIIKEKRLNYNVSNEYTNFIKSFDNMNFIEKVPSDTSIFKIIKLSDLTISLPFSTPSVIAKNLGVQSIYFDPINVIDKDLSGHDITTYNNSNIYDYLIKFITND